MFFRQKKPETEQPEPISERDSELLVELFCHWKQNYYTYIKPSKVFTRPTEIKSYKILLSVAHGICVEIIDEFGARHIADVEEFGRIKIREERF